VVVGVGAAVVAGGAFVVSRYADRTTKGCASVGTSVDGKAGTSFLPHCLEPGMAMVGGLVLVIGGGVLLLWGLSAMVRSWRQRVHRRALGPDILPPLVHPDRRVRPSEPTTEFASNVTAAISPPPGWYAVPPDYKPMWWDGRAWAVAPTLPSVPTGAGEAHAG
jgi:hypothetical protein